MSAIPLLRADFGPAPEEVIEEPVPSANEERLRTELAQYIRECFESAKQQRINLGIDDIMEANDLRPRDVRRHLCHAPQPTPEITYVDRNWRRVSFVWQCAERSYFASDLERSKENAARGVRVS